MDPEDRILDVCDYIESGRGLYDLCQEADEAAAEEDDQE